LLKFAELLRNRETEMPIKKEGILSAKGLKFGVVVARFNEFINNRLLSGCLDGLIRHGAADEDIEIAWVPGSFEIPQVAHRMAAGKKYNAVICLGALIRGDTPHFEYISSQVIRELSLIARETGVPLSLGIITADTLEQAIDRAGAKAGNKGWFAALSAIEMADLYRKL
jgi:6,7-dimethyl-8-ribityllumazine synthase